MLVGLAFNKDDSLDFKEEVGVAVGKTLGGKVRVLQPKDLSEYVDVLKGYNPRNASSLVLLNTHLDYADDLSLGAWRATDLAFNQKGGVIFGEAPKNSSTAFRAKIADDGLDYMAVSANYYRDRALDVKKSAPDYIGRIDSDPHTLVLGFSPSWPKLSVSADALLAGLPLGAEEPWWWGVGYYNRRNRKNVPAGEAYQEILDRFYFSSRVVVSDGAEEVMDLINEPYQRAENIRFKTVPEGEKYGKELRRLSRLDSERVVE